MDDDMLNTKQAADYLKISDRTLRNYISERKIQYLRMSDRIILFKREWLDDFINKSIIPVKENE